MIGGMIWPGRTAHENACLRVGRREKLETEPERAAAARRLKARNTIIAGMFAKHDRPKHFGKALVARASEIGLALLRRVQAALGFLDDLQDRRVARAVTENADADVDLVGTRIGVDEADQRNERVAVNGRKIGKAAGLRVGGR